MTIEEVKERVHQVGAKAADDEAAHMTEDDLHESVLAAIAAGAADAKLLAAEALKTRDFEFQRWCA